MKTVIIADDSLFIRMNLKEILKSGGYELAGEAANGEEAVELYKNIQPDLAILDITMPVLDGLGALKAIKALNQDAKVIMCTAMGQKQFVEEAIRYGVSDFIIKPFAAERVLLSIKKVFES